MKNKRKTKVTLKTYTDNYVAWLGSKKTLKTFNQIDLGNYNECEILVSRTENKRYRTYLSTSADKIGASANLISIKDNLNKMLLMYEELNNESFQEFYNADLLIEASIRKEIIEHSKVMELNKINELIYDLDLQNKLNYDARMLILHVVKSPMQYYLQERKVNIIDGIVSSFIANGYEFYHGENLNDKYDKFWDYLHEKFKDQHLESFINKYHSNNKVAEMVLEHLKVEFPYHGKYPSTSAVRNHLGFKDN